MPHPHSDLPLILASSSPQRRMLLTQAGYEFQICSPRPTAECGICARETPPELAARMAYQKAADVAAKTPRGIVLGCDTVAECQGLLLGKPCDARHARQMLTLISGREHRVYSGLCLWPRPVGQPLLRVERTTLRMDNLSADQLDEYIASGQWEGKSGAFGYQDRAGWLHVIEGSEANVIGLPLELLAAMLTELEVGSG